MKRTIHLHGTLGEEFGRQYILDVDSTAEAVRALSVVLEQGKEFLARIKAGEWHLLAGESVEKGQDFGDESMLRFGLGKNDLHIIPALAGSSGQGGGIAKVVIGVAIIVAATYFGGPAGGTTATKAVGAGSGVFTAASFKAMGIAIALSGVAQIMTPTPQVGSYSDREKPDERPSFLFMGAKNTTEQGGPVPVVYGEHLVGGTLVSYGTVLEEL